MRFHVRKPELRFSAPRLSSRFKRFDRQALSHINWRALLSLFLTKTRVFVGTVVRALRKTSPTQRWVGSIVLTGIFAFFIGYQARNFVPVATVNGDPIDRRLFSERLFKQAGEGVLNEFISEALVHQEAKRQNVKITDKEIDRKIEEVERLLKSQGMVEEAALAKNPKAREDLEREIRNQLLIEKLFGKNVRVTEEDIESYFQKTKVKRGEGAIYESQKITIRQLMYQKKLRERFITWLNLQKRDARIRVLIR